MLVHVADASSVPLVRQLLHAQEYWRVKDLRADLVILKDHPADYLDEVQNQLSSLVREPRWGGWLDKPGGMFLMRSDGMPEVDCRLLSAVARIVLRGDLGDLAPQLDRKAPWPSAADIVPDQVGVRVEAGDVLLVRTGNYRKILEQGPVPGTASATACQVACTPWFKERDIAMLGTDTSNDVRPSHYANVATPLHTVSLVEPQCRHTKITLTWTPPAEEVEM